MQLFCQNCQAAFAASTHCPRCGTRLLSPQESFLQSGPAKPLPPDQIPPTFTNRLIVGMLVALGVMFGLRELASAWVLVQSGSASEQWVESNVNSTTFAIRLFAVMAGGLVAGACRPFGIQVGAATGLLVGSLLTCFDLYASGITDRTAMLLTLAYPVIAGLAGAAGSWLWPPDVILPEPKGQSSHGSTMVNLATEDALLRSARPMHWLQIAAAAVLVFTGVTFSEPIRLALAKNSAGLLHTGGVAKAAWIGLQIATISIILAGVIAAAGTGAGLKHGLLAGAIAGFGILLGSQNRANGLYPAVEGFLHLFEIDPDPLTSPRIAIDFLMALLTLMGVSGWLGGELLPPLVPRKHRSRRMQALS